MIQKLLIAIIVVVPSLSFAETKVKITSFYYTDTDFESKNTSAELCGVVTEKPEDMKSVVIVADPGKHEGRYHVGLTSTGHFCHIVRVVYGEAKVKIPATEGRKALQTRVFSVSEIKR